MAIKLVVDVQNYINKESEKEIIVKKFTKNILFFKFSHQ